MGHFHLKLRMLFNEMMIKSNNNFFGQYKGIKTFCFTANQTFEYIFAKTNVYQKIFVLFYCSRHFQLIFCHLSYSQIELANNNRSLFDYNQHSQYCNGGDLADYLNGNSLFFTKSRIRIYFPLFQQREH